MSQARSLGFWTAVLCGFAVLQATAVLVFGGTSKQWFQASIGDDLLWVRLAIGWGTCQLSLALLSAAVLRRTARLPRGTRGRARIVALGITTGIHVLMTTVSVGILLWAARESVGHVLGGTVASLLFGLTHLAYADLDLAWLPTLYETVTTAQGLSSALIVVLSMSCWFLVPIARRDRFWWVFDAALAVAFVLVTTLLPITPAEGDDSSLLRAVVRVSVTTIFGVRLTLRLVGPLLSLFERIGFRSMVAARHLRAKKTGFLAASSTLSILAVAVSSCMLISVLSVMGGFRADLEKKILGNHAHIVIDKAYEEIDDWEPLLNRTRGTEGVVGATPFLQVEVMVSSLSNRAGALLRGIDPATVSEVTDLAQNLTHGKLEYLQHPERILDSSIDTTQTGALDAMIEDAERAAAKGLPSETREESMPGLIVGQELARALRLVVGDRVTVVSPRGDLGPTGPIPKTRPFRIAGIFYSGMYEYDMKHAYIDLGVAQRFLRADGRISGVEVKVEEVEDAPALAAELASSIGLGGVRVRDWKMMNQQLFGALALEKLAMFITLGIAILIAGFSVFGTLTLLVQEKRREVGILKAMGTSARGVIRIFVIEGLLIGAAGGLMGLGLGFVLTFAAEHFGIRMNPEVYYIDKLPVHLDPTEFAVVGAATVLVCLAATLFPAYQASRVRPVDALRYD
ncbi:MAG: ABC transporter permease [Deltaproteobacteria bacterium]|nr:ABC transporter permease [Deltaproteobacteria bacterium]NND27551.1 ABC transporter permease [Myxococcales bacterium]MBT8465600.1 ABC transporter permease [Deltaproteobacteria bacterium]MBT8480539.1 ABC transporter permease [Deltaproteobacteria bacterium]NNK09620.1 ABC transporter permease [Myxococcales bacterium]